MSRSPEAERALAQAHQLRAWVRSLIWRDPGPTSRLDAVVLVTSLVAFGAPLDEAVVLAEADLVERGYIVPQQKET